MSDEPKAGGATASPDGSEHDAWLREALRHAPDASAAPPVSLRDAILAEARAATRSVAAPRAAPTPSLLDRLLEFWSWLARPQVAAGFASVMAATLVGMLWWDRPLDEAMVAAPSSPPAAATMAEATKQAPVVASAREPAPAAAAAPSPAPNEKATTLPAKSAPLPAPGGTTAASLEDRKRRADLGQGVATEAERAEPSRRKDQRPADALADERKNSVAKLDAQAPDATKTAPATVAPSPFPARAPVADDALARRPPPAAAPMATMPPAATPPATQPPAAAPAVPPAPAAGPRAEPFALAKKAELSDKEGAAAQGRSAAAAPAPAPAPVLREAAPAGAAARPTSEADTAATGRLSAARNQAELAPRQRSAEAFAASARPMAQLLAALASEPARWSRPVRGGESVAVDAALQAWLAQVQAATTRWDPAADSTSRRDAARDSPAAPATLLLDREGRPGALVRVEDGGVYFDPRSGPTWFAPLPPEVVARLRATLPAATR
jgi:hypothetical protein